MMRIGLKYFATALAAGAATVAIAAAPIAAASPTDQQANPAVAPTVVATDWHGGHGGDGGWHGGHGGWHRGDGGWHGGWDPFGWPWGWHH
jgi:hypothetical protein